MTGALAGGDPDEILDRVGLQDVADERVDRLPTGTARLIELGRALATQPRVLLLDEPSAGLNESETSTLGSLLQEVAGSGLAVLLVEHDMQFVMGTCARIHVLDFGRIISVGTPKEVQADDTVRSAYLGEADERRRTAPAAAAMTATDRATDGRAGPRATRHPRRVRHHRGASRCEPDGAGGVGLRAARPEWRGQVDHAPRGKRRDRAHVRRRP